MNQPYDIRVKPITTTSKTPTIPQGRDTFLTPRYATELLLPFIPKSINTIWECAAGDGRIAKVFKNNGYSVISTDIRTFPDVEIYNFVTGEKKIFYKYNFAIITNPPFSIKEKFIDKALEYGVPFAFLINADYSGVQIKWIEKYECEKIIPTRRINFITPNITNRINEKEGTDYEKIDDVPLKLLGKYSSAQFHSKWLTHGFKLGKTETFVDLTNHQIKNNIL